MLVNKFIKFLESLEGMNAPYVDIVGQNVIIDGHVPRDELEEFLSKLELS